MNITLNGASTDIENNETLEQLIQRLDIKGQVATSVNDEIIHHHNRDGITLKEGDTLEIFTMLGGG